MAFANPSPADRKLPPRHHAGNDKRRGEGRCSFFKWYLFVSCGTSPSSDIHLNVVAQNRREVMFYHPPPLRSCTRGIAQATTSARRGSRFVSSWCLCVISTTSPTSNTKLNIFVQSHLSWIRNSRHASSQGHRSRAHPRECHMAATGKIFLLVWFYPCFAHASLVLWCYCRSEAASQS